MAGAILAEAQVSLFMAGAIFGDVQVSLFVAGAIFGEVEVSLFVAGAIFREIWNMIAGARNFVLFQRNSLGARQLTSGCGLTYGFMVGSFSDHARIGRALQPKFSHTLAGHFSWQAQYLARLDNDTCCFAHCK